MVIYKIVCLTNNKIYIGLSRNFKNRKRKHLNLLRANKHFNKFLQNTYNKYGEDSFGFEIIENVENENFLSEREKYYIQYYKSNDREYGFNLNSGGDEIDFEICEKTKKKLRDKHLNKPLSEEHKEKISKANKGKIVSEKHKKILSDKMKYYHNIGLFDKSLKNLRPHKVGEFKHTEETKKNIGLCRKNKTYEEIFGVEKAFENKKKRSISSIGENNPFYKKIDIDLVKKLINEGKKINEISNQLDCTRQTLLYKFKQEYGITIQQYKNSIRDRN